MHEASYPALTQAINQQLAPFRKAQEGTMSGFTAMAKAAMAPGELSEKHKELIALAIGISQRCEGCVDSASDRASRMRTCGFGTVLLLYLSHGAAHAACTRGAHEPVSLGYGARPPGGAAATPPGDTL